METRTINKTAISAEVIRHAYAAFNAADMNALNDIFHDNSSWHTPGKSSIGGNRKGKENVFAQFGRYGGETNGTFKATLKTVAVCDDGRIVGIHHNSAERNGEILDVDCCIVFEVKDGQIFSGKEYFFDLNAWDAFWA